MTTKPQNIALALALAMLAGCATGEKAYNRGDYDKAVLQATKRLKSDTDNGDAIATLRQAYPAAQSLHLQNIARASRSSAPFKWETVVAEYSQLNILAEAIRRTPAALNVIPAPVIYADDLEAAKESAAEARYTAGDAALTKGGHENAREAFHHFSTALLHRSNYRDARDKLEIAREAATIKVVINPIACASRDIDVAFVENNLKNFLNDYRPGPFVRFLTSNEAAVAGIKTPDHIIDMKFDGFAVAQAKLEEKSQQVQKDNVVIGQTRSNPPQEVIGTAKATVITYKKTVSSNAQLDFKITEGATARVLNHKKLPGSYVWKHEWGTFRGDERAVPANLRKIVNRREVQPPGRQVLFTGFAEPIFQQACDELKRFYSRYQ